MASLVYSQYRGEQDLLDIIALVEKDLSEPYSIFVYRFFLQRHPELCFTVSSLDM
jgi:peptide alpha-N-acetyltransferase